jgi:hypothetical protein
MVPRTVDVPRERVRQTPGSQVDGRKHIRVAGVGDYHGFPRAKHHAAVFVDPAPGTILIGEHQAHVRRATAEQAPQGKR